jgi:hypothetical protein
VRLLRAVDWVCVDLVFIFWNPHITYRPGLSTSRLISYLYSYYRRVFIFFSLGKEMESLEDEVRIVPVINLLSSLTRPSELASNWPFLS